MQNGSTMEMIRQKTLAAKALTQVSAILAMLTLHGGKESQKRQLAQRILQLRELLI